MKERVIITGANGQLGKQLQEELNPEEYDIYPFDKKVVRYNKYIPSAASGTRNKATYHYSLCSVYEG